MSTTSTGGSGLALPGRPCFFEFSGNPRATCFCQLAGNPGCAGKPWACGATGAALQHPKSVTFRNIATAQRCANPTALLTIPKSYFEHIQFLLAWCPAGSASLLEEMIREGFLSYQQLVAPGTVRQCIHAGFHVSVPWLHLHTVCAAGVVDQMFRTGSAAYCHDMSSPGEAAALAAAIISWAGGPRWSSGDRPFAAPGSCAQIGCGMGAPAHHCSCSWSCPTFRNCCGDYRATCLHSCHAMGCGRFISGSNCSCAAGCELHGCCGDHRRVCLRPQAPRTCKQLGCGSHEPGGCSCNGRCREFGDCCEDYAAACRPRPRPRPRSTCRELGCGRRAQGANCSCNARCKHYGDCCEDYEVACAADARRSRPSTCREIGCGESSEGICFCNDRCERYGDCCADYRGTCKRQVLP